MAVGDATGLREGGSEESRVPCGRERRLLAAIARCCFRCSSSPPTTGAAASPSTPAYAAARCCVRADDPLRQRVLHNRLSTPLTDVWSLSCGAVQCSSRSLSTPLPAVFGLADAGRQASKSSSPATRVRQSP